MRKYLLVLFVIVLLILGFAFYWFEYRPSMIIKKCYEISNNDLPKSTNETFSIDKFRNEYVPGYNQTTKEINYKNCLRENGLEQ